MSRNLTAVVQEVVGLPGFTGLIGMTYRSTTATNGWQSFVDYSDNSAQAALLTVTYTAGGGGGTPTPTVTPTPIPTCNVSTVTAPATMTVEGACTSWTVSAVPSSGSVSSVTFLTGNSTIATVTNPGTFVSPNYQSTVCPPPGGSAGSTTLTASCLISGISRGTGTTTATVVAAPTPTRTPTPAPPTPTPTPGTQVASVRVGATEKDGESYETTEYYLLTSAPWNTMYLGSDGSPYDGGWIFQTAIPQGATVTNATVTITGGGDNSGTVAGSWYGFRTVAVPDFEDGVTNHRISDHVTRTTLSTPDNFGVVGSGATHVSPNLATVVQEVVSLPGFTGLIGMTYRSSTTGVNYQSFMDHSNDPNQAALLTVTYTAGGGGTPTPTPTPSSSIAGWWKFDENSGVSAGDSSGSGNTLTFGGNPTWSVGKVGSALTFDGTDDKAYVADPINGSLDMGSGDFSLAAWVKLDPTYTDANPTVIFKGAGSDTEPGYWLFWSNSSNYLRFTISSGVGTRPTVNSTAGVIKDNLWHHVAAVAVRSGVSKLYIDGVLNASSNWSAYTGSIDTASNFVIGSHLIGPAATDWKGQIDDVRMYEKALSDVEITDIYNQGALTPTATPTSTPVPVNLLANPGFESGTTGWSFYTDGTGTFNTTTPGASGAGSKARVTLTTLGTNTQMWQKPLSFATNTSYRLSYKAYGSRSGEKVGAFIDNVNASQMGNVATMSTSWQTFTFDFVTPAAIYDPANAGLRFWFANSQGVSGNQAGDIFYIDDVSITPL